MSQSKQQAIEAIEKAIAKLQETLDSLKSEPSAQALDITSGDPVPTDPTHPKG